MFEYLIQITPLGLMYGSAGTFLSPENLVGRSGQKFPPDAATLSGLFFNAASDETMRKTLKQELHVSGPFWAKTKRAVKEDIYVPVPRTKVFGEDGSDSWYLEKTPSGTRKWRRENRDLESHFEWMPVSNWTTKKLGNVKRVAKSPWNFMPMLHPKMEMEERCSIEADGLFLENAVRLDEDISLIYLSTHELKPDWYRFGGESHLVEIESHKIDLKASILGKLLTTPITDKFALIAPAVWSSNRFSYRAPKDKNDFPAVDLMLTNKPVFHRYRMGGRLGRGRYAVPAGSVYVLEKPINRTWWDWPKGWFSNTQKEDVPLKHFGCGLCLPLDIDEQLVEQTQQGAA